MSKNEETVKELMEKNGYALSKNGKSYWKKGLPGETVYVKNRARTTVPRDRYEIVYVEIFDEKVGDYTDRRFFESLAHLFYVGYDIGLH